MTTSEWLYGGVVVLIAVMLVLAIVFRARRGQGSRWSCLVMMVLIVAAFLIALVAPKNGAP